MLVYELFSDRVLLILLMIGAFLWIYNDGFDDDCCQIFYFVVVLIVDSVSSCVVECERISHCFMFVFVIGTWCLLLCVLLVLVMLEVVGLLVVIVVFDFGVYVEVFVFVDELVVFGYGCCVWCFLWRRSANAPILGDAFKLVVVFVDKEDVVVF